MPLSTNGSTLTAMNGYSSPRIAPLRRCTTSTPAQLHTNYFAQPVLTNLHFVRVEESGSSVTSSPDASPNATGPPPTPNPSAGTSPRNGKGVRRRSSFIGSLLFGGGAPNSNSPSTRKSSNASTARVNGHTNGISHREDDRSSNTSSGIWIAEMNGHRSASTPTIVEHRPSTAREAAIRTFEVISRKRICVVRKFGSDMDNHITLLLDTLGRDTNTDPTYLTVDQQTGAEILHIVQRPGLPLLFLNGDCIGGISELRRAQQRGFLAESLRPHDFDLIVVGGGAGGIAAAMEAASLGKRVACVDLPPPDGAVGGSCMNVGRVPRKLMQQAALIGALIKGADQFGWSTKAPEFDWGTMRDAVREHVAEQNARNESDLVSKGVTYIKAMGRFSGTHSLIVTFPEPNGNGDVEEREITADRFFIAVGLRSKLPEVRNAAECCVGSDDLFTLARPPGRTLCVGDSFQSLETAAFLAATGNDVTVSWNEKRQTFQILTRTDRIRGFDEDVGDRIRQHLTQIGVKFIVGQITRLQREAEPTADESPLITAEILSPSDEELTLQFNTVIAAAQREPRTMPLQLQKLDVKLSAAAKILGRHEQSQTAPHVYAVGDVLEGATEFSQLSAHGARLLMRRLYTGSVERADYERVMSSLLLPMEFCGCGLTEADAQREFGGGAVVVHEANVRTADAAVQLAAGELAFVKAVFLRTENDRLVGFQVLAPHAADLATGFALALRLNARRADLQSIVGVHPSAAEAFARLEPQQRRPNSTFID